MDGKRKDVEEEGSSLNETSGALVIKKQKTGSEVALSTNGSGTVAKTVASIPRTSGLQAPIMLLTGHKAEVNALQFSPSGKHLCSASFDKTVSVWNVYGECDNTMVLRGHSSAVLDVHWSYDGSYIFSASADKTVAVWDVETGQRIKKMVGHSSFVNGCSSTRKGEHLVVSGSDDNTIKLWDLRARKPVDSYDTQYPVTTVAFSKEGDQIFSAGIDNDIKVWNVRQSSIENRYEGHEDTVTDIKLSPDGVFLLSNSMDNTVRIWDTKPYVKGSRCIKVFQGASHNFEKNLLRCAWSADGKKISAGSADRFVYIWDTTSRKILYKLPGHKGSVNAVDFHPLEPIIGSASSDKTIYLGEIKP